jgi:alginate O-acetyltransferase complex protein AlgI
MLFNSVEFLLFFPIVVSLYLLIKHSQRWVLLLVASYYFYMAWKPEYILLIVASTFIDYFCGRKMGAIEEKKKRRPFLYLSLLTNLGILFTFKYFDFFTDSVEGLANYFHLPYESPALQLILPMGISFYTFQTMSYSVDIYQGKLKPEKHFGIFALFVSFFPQLVAGPIERAANLLPQFHKKFTFDRKKAVSGLQLMLWGMFKKVVVADRLAFLVNAVYDQPGEYEGFTLFLATLFFAFQIYCDFSGYSDIAIGAARILGFDLMKNFDTPYSARNVSEFWRRWHISLSTWFKDYVYIPLGGNRVVKWRWYYNLMITFLVSGLWHGANWTFVIWGGLHGFYLVSAIWTAKIRSSVNATLGLSLDSKILKTWDIALNFVLVCLAWVFFRANTVTDGFYIIAQIFDGKTGDLFHLIQNAYYALPGVKIGEEQIGLSSIITAASGAEMGLSYYEFVLAVFSILLVVLTEYLHKQRDLRTLLWRMPVVLRWGVYYGMIYLILGFRSFSTSEFIYFQF